VVDNHIKYRHYDSSVAVSITALAVLIIALRILARQFVSPNCSEGTGWIDELSTDRYRPMLHLLDEEDFKFLRNQPGFTNRLGTKLRIQRCQIFRGYLRNLDTDFRRICMALKCILLHSKIDRPDLVSTLLRNQMVFAYRKMTIQFQVVLFRYGFGTVDVSGLVNVFDGMRLELRTLVPAQMASGA